jgi:hypothetical protein
MTRSASRRRDANGTLETITFPGPNVQVDHFEVDRVGRIKGVDYERNATVWASL